jgi:hypothetical protein
LNEISTYKKIKLKIFMGVLERLERDLEMENLIDLSGRQYLEALKEVKSHLIKSPDSVKDFLWGRVFTQGYTPNISKVYWENERIPNDPFPIVDFQGFKYTGLKHLKELEKASGSAIAIIATHGTLRALVSGGPDNRSGPVYWFDGENYFVPETIRSLGRNYPSIILGK